MGFFSTDAKPCVACAFNQELILKLQQQNAELTARVCQLADPVMDARLAAVERTKLATAVGAEQARNGKAANKADDFPRAVRPQQFRNLTAFADKPSQTKALTPDPRREAR